MMILGFEAFNMAETLTATEVARRFADVLNRVAYRRESFVVVRGKRPLAELRPLPVGMRLADLPAVVAGVPRLRPDEADAFADDLDAARATVLPLDPADAWAS